MRTLLLGSAGQLGRDLAAVLPGEVIPLTRADGDLTDPNALTERIRRDRPDVVINCAAYNFVDRAEDEPDACFAVNAWAVRRLADTCSAIGTRLVQFSTDYVFGHGPGRTSPWNEDENPVPNSVYGASKLVGECFVRSADPRHMVIRTCGLFGVWGSGGKGGNFVETMLRLAREGKPIRVVSDQQCTPTFTADLAKTTKELIQRGAEGVFHVVNGGSCTWHEFAAAVFALSGTTADLHPITSTQFGAKAKRPAYSVLGMNRLELVGVPTPRPWRDALAEYLRIRGSKRSSA